MIEEIGQAGLSPTDRALSVAGQNMYLAKVMRVDAEKYRVDVASLGEGDEFFACRIAGREFWMPQVDDIVIVAFLDDSLSNPIVLSKILLSKDDLVQSSEADTIHGRHTVKDSDGKNRADLEWSTDAEGNLTLNVRGLSGNLMIVTDGEVNINNGSKGAARDGDSVEVTIPQGVFLVPATTPAGFAPNPAPVTVTGKISEGSEKVKVG